MMLKVALPTGKLEPETLRLFNEADIPVMREDRKLILSLCNNRTVQEVRFVKPQHIPEIVSRGICDVGICGEDSVAESFMSWDTQVLLRLPYGQCGRDGRTKVVVFCGAGEKPQIPYWRPEREWVISEYPNISEQFFKRERWMAHVIPSYGGAEVLVPHPYTFGVCLVETGETLRVNGLQVFSVILESSTAMIASMRIDRKKWSAINNLRGRLKQASKALFH